MNLVTFVTVFVFLFLETMFMQTSLAERYIKFIAIASFPVAIAANGIRLIPWAIQNIIAPYYGASTLVYAFFGLIFGLSAAVLIPDPKSKNYFRRNSWIILSNATVFAGIAAFAYFNFSAFFTVAQGIDYPAHELGFAIGMVLMLIYARFYPHLKDIKTFFFRSLKPL